VTAEAAAPTALDPLEAVRESAFPTAEFVRQQSLVSAREIRSLARAAGIRLGTSVLDLCCGGGGPGSLLVAETGCTYLGVDADPAAVALARTSEELRRPGSGVAVGRVPPVPPGPFDVVLLLETLLAFPDKPALFAQIASVLPVGGRFACTVEEGAPLTAEERARMPRADTVWPVPYPELVTDLEAVGFQVRWQADWSGTHRRTAEAMAEAYATAAEHPGFAGHALLLAELVTSHRLWSAWLRSGRVRKLGLVAERHR
jgi:SAM-dependent methyltransferase